MSTEYHEGWTTADLKKVKAYLPSNYDAYVDEETDRVVIYGNDRAGWTWEDYVLPRLGSGLIGVTTVS